MFQTTTLINWCAILNIEVSNNESKRSAFLKRWHRHSGSIEVFLLSRYQDPWSKNAILLALYHNVVFAYKVLIRADSSGKTATIKFCKFEDVKETVKFKLSASNFLEWSLKLFLCEISDKYYLNRSAFTDGWVSKKFSPMHVSLLTPCPLLGTAVFISMNTQSVYTLGNHKKFIFLLIITVF
jgi:hypothetical protein